MRWDKGMLNLLTVLRPLASFERLWKSPCLLQHFRGEFFHVYTFYIFAVEKPILWFARLPFIKLEKHGKLPWIPSYSQDFLGWIAVIIFSTCQNCGVEIPNCQFGELLKVIWKNNCRHDSNHLECFKIESPYFRSILTVAIPKCSLKNIGLHKIYDWTCSLKSVYTTSLIEIPHFHENWFTLWWTNILPWKVTMLLMGKSTISMAIFHGKMLVHQRLHNIYDWNPVVFQAMFFNLRSRPWSRRWRSWWSWMAMQAELGAGLVWKSMVNLLENILDISRY